MRLQQIRGFKNYGVGGMKKKEYLTFADIQELVEGKELTLAIRDLTAGKNKYDCRYVKARIYASKGKSSQGDILWVRSWSGFLYPQPLSINITEESGEVIPGRPHG